MDRRRRDPNSIGPNKRCSKCGVEKSMEKFNRDKTTFDGRGFWCKECIHLKYISKRGVKPLRSYGSERVMQQMIIQHYGAVCVCCGLDIVEFLTIDHKNNDGAKERQLLGRYKMLKRIIARGYPDTYQVLCFNCNIVTGQRGWCPHERYSLPKSIVVQLPERYCQNCEKVQPPDAFYVKRNGSKLYTSSICKECSRQAERVRNRNVGIVPNTNDKRFRVDEDLINRVNITTLNVVDNN